MTGLRHQFDQNAIEITRMHEDHRNAVGADARPAFADNLPRLVRRGDRLHVNGLFRHGFLLAPALARMAADHLLDMKTPEVME